MDPRTPLSQPDTELAAIPDADLVRVARSNSGKAKSRSLGPAGLGMTTDKREEGFFGCASRPEIVNRDFRRKGGGTLHHPIARKNGARWGPRLRSE